MIGKAERRNALQPRIGLQLLQRLKGVKSQVVHIEEDRPWVDGQGFVDNILLCTCFFKLVFRLAQCVPDFGVEK